MMFFSSHGKALVPSRALLFLPLLFTGRGLTGRGGHGILPLKYDKRGERMKLRDLASVRSGLVLSRKQAKEPSEYRYPLINLRCIQQEGTIQLNEADIYEAKEPLKEEYLSQSGDIIVRLTAP